MDHTAVFGMRLPARAWPTALTTQADLLLHLLPQAAHRPLRRRLAAALAHPRSPLLPTKDET